MTTHAAHSRPVPSPGGSLPLVGHLLGFQPQPLDFCLRAKREYGDLVRIRVATNDWYVLSAPRHVHRVLVTEASNFEKPALAKRLWKPFLGNGIVASDGPYWKRQHKLILPGFHKKRIDGYGEAMVRLTEAMVAGWTPGERRDICNDFTDLTLAIVAKTLFDADVSGKARHVGHLMDVINQLLVDHIHMPVELPRWWPSQGNRRKVSALDDFRRVVREIIEERRASGVDHGDLLSTLVFARDEAGKSMTDSEIHDEAVTLFFAGHETTSIALTYMWYLLATHQDVQEKVKKEIESVVGDRPLTVTDLPKLPYLDMVVKESMRILPPVWSYMRAPIEDFIVDDYTIPSRAIVFISPFILQHDRRSFPDPETFRPERFLPAEEAKIPQGAYVPFAAGPRVCLGKNFAMMEARLVLGTLVQHCRITIPDDYEIVFFPRLALRPKHGMPSDVELREPRRSPVLGAEPRALS
jgi:cytochrome P450